MSTTLPGAHPPIGDYAFLSDCHTAALLSPEGTVEWLCVPRFDSPSVFGRLLDRKDGGGWQVSVEGAERPQRAYLDDSLVLESVWHAPGGEALGYDFLAVDSYDSGGGILPVGVLVRIVNCVQGTVRVCSRTDARPGYGARHEHWTGEDSAVRGEHSAVLLSGNVALSLGEEGAVDGEAELRAGESMVVALDYTSRRQTPLEAREAHELQQRTLGAWQEWSARSDYRGAGARHVRRSAAVLRGLLCEETGGLLAAPTTSLPEWPGGERNWDYRFVWHRDASLVVLALLRLGHTEEAGRYLRFLLDHAGSSSGRLGPVMAVDGGPTPEERLLDHWEGYAESRPVRVGNGAEGQWQLDSYGHILDAALVYQEVTGELGDEDLTTLARLATWVCEHWRERDHGIWEVRDEGRHWTSSKLYAWVCLDRAIRLHDLCGVSGQALGRWHRERDAVRADLLRHGYDESLGAFVQSYGAGNMDASLLRVPLVGFLAGDDARVVGTIERVDAELGTEHGLVHRYDAAATADGFESPEGAFLLCSFDMVSALVLAGRTGEARKRFEHLCEQESGLGLFSEEMSSEGTMLGNYPQAFTHLSLIEAAMNVNDDEKEEALHTWAHRQADGPRPARAGRGGPTRPET